MKKKEMLINVLQPEEIRIAIVEDGVLEELYVERTSHESYVGNIYKGRIVNIEPSIQAAFVDFGVGRNGFLHVSDVEPAYYRHLETGPERGRDRGRGRSGENNRRREPSRPPGRQDRQGFRPYDVEEDFEEELAAPGGPLQDELVEPDEEFEEVVIEDDADDFDSESEMTFEEPEVPEAEVSEPGLPSETRAEIGVSEQETFLPADPAELPPEQEGPAEAAAAGEEPAAEPMAEVEETPKRGKRRGGGGGRGRGRRKNAEAETSAAQDAAPGDSPPEGPSAGDADPPSKGDEPWPPPFMGGTERRTEEGEESSQTPSSDWSDEDLSFSLVARQPEPAAAPTPEEEEWEEEIIGPEALDADYPGETVEIVDEEEAVEEFAPDKGDEEEPLAAPEGEMEPGLEIIDEMEEDDFIPPPMPSRGERGRGERDRGERDRGERDRGERDRGSWDRGDRRSRGGRDRDRDDRGRREGRRDGGRDFGRDGGRDAGREGGPRRGGRMAPGRAKPLIQEIFKRGQEVLVQVIKEGIGTKGPTLSTYISIAGRYLVLMPGLNRIGVSRKIQDDDSRRRLRDIMRDLQPPPGLGFIIRTAGMDRTKIELQRDLSYLSRLWQVVARRIRKMKSPCEIYQESDMVTRTIRDIFTNDIDAIFVDEPTAYEHAREFLQIVMPHYVDHIKLWDNPEPMFHRYGIEREIARIQKKTVPLSNGGSIVIEPTEALVAIDVNSGNFRAADKDAEETAYQMNLVAAREIARQLRLRDLGGVIINDFIDMREEKHRRSVEKALRDAVRRDRARTKILRISPFGIIEMTRQRIRPSLKRSVYRECPHCLGTSQVKTTESMGIEVMRLLQLAIHQVHVHAIEIAVHEEVASWLLNRKRREMARLEEDGGKEILVRGRPGVAPEFLEIVCTDENGHEVKFLPYEEPPPARGGRGRGRGRDRG